MLFLILPTMLRAGYAFWPALGVGCGATILCYGAEALILGALGIRL